MDVGRSSEFRDRQTCRFERGFQFAIERRHPGVLNCQGNALSPHRPSNYLAPAGSIQYDRHVIIEYSGMDAVRPSQHFETTLKEAPREAQAISHELLQRAGFLRSVAAGLPVVMPALLRVRNRLAGPS
jgi:hypothetical protein